jgi:N-methylhydantoinase A
VPVGSGAPVTPGRSLKGYRAVQFSSDTPRVEAAIHDRSLIADGERLCGPAIIEQDDSTTLLPPGWSASLTDGAALLLTRSGS